LNSTFHYVHGQGDLSCIEFFVLSSVVCDDWSVGSTSHLQTYYIDSLRRTDSKLRGIIVTVSKATEYLYFSMHIFCIVNSWNSKCLSFGTAISIEV
jgi:hypothetical protein